MPSNQNLLPFLYFCNSRLFYQNIFLSNDPGEMGSHLVLFGCSEVNSTWLITSELANQRARKALFTCVVYTNNNYCFPSILNFSFSVNASFSERDFHRNLQDSIQMLDMILQTERNLNVHFILGNTGHA